MESPIRIIDKHVFYFAEYDLLDKQFMNRLFGLTELPIEVDIDGNVGFLNCNKEQNGEHEMSVFSAIRVPLIIVAQTVQSKLVFHYIPQYGIYAAES
jgi:hypothetical protein